MFRSQLYLQSRFSSVLCIMLYNSQLKFMDLRIFSYKPHERLQWGRWGSVCSYYESFGQRCAYFNGKTRHDITDGNTCGGVIIWAAGLAERHVEYRAVYFITPVYMNFLTATKQLKLETPSASSSSTFFPFCLLSVMPTHKIVFTCSKCLEFQVVIEVVWTFKDVTASLWIASDGIENAEVFWEYENFPENFGKLLQPHHDCYTFFPRWRFSPSCPSCCSSCYLHIDQSVLLHSFEHY